MITLIIETSTEKSLIAFAQEDTLLFHHLLPAGMQSSRFLMKAIAEGFQKLDALPVDVKAIAVGVGPGSYTGIRVGAAAAKGLAFSGRTPLIAMCSLEGFISQEEGRWISLIDARIGGYYALFQERRENQVFLLSEPQLLAREEVKDILDKNPRQAGPHIAYPDPGHLARIAEAKFKKELYSEDLELIYLRTPSYQAC